MARNKYYRRRRTSRNIINNNYTNVRYSSGRAPGGQPVLGSILQLIVMLALLAAIVVCVGPVIDFFASYVNALPAGAAAYKNAVLPLYAWAYAFIALVAIIGFVAVYRNVIRTIIYGRWNE